MKAIALIPGTTNLRLVERPEVNIQNPTDIKLRVLRVGICGTDREEASGGRALAPEGNRDLVIGHEMFSQVVAVGEQVTRVKPGDLAVITVRRGCGKCLPCQMNRSDMCRTGQYHERGIWGLDGYQCEYVVDDERYVVRVPAELEAVGVLAEPLSVAEKAITEAVRLQFARLPDAHATPDWLNGRRCLVAGLGPIGLLAAVALRLRGAEVYGLDIVDEGSARPRWLEAIGGHYVDGRKVSPLQVDDKIGAMDLIFEATGVAQLAFNLTDALAPDGVYVLTGIPGGNRPTQLSGDELIRQFVLDNQVMAGSVNAARDHFQMAVDDLTAAKARWGDHVNKLITARYPYTQFAEAINTHPADEIKTVIEWAESQEAS
jgi:threonine dehydrogenase-like Zn-dependent dehydrogenase